jgi:hypothetical protein
MSFLYWRTNLTRSLLAGSVYYLGASAGNTYLYLFWQWQQWQGVAIGATNILFIPLLAALWLRKVERTYLQGKP